MKIILAQNCGFCFGVKLAIDKVEEVLEKNKKKNIPIYSIGPVIHNPQVVNKLKERGLKIIEDIDEIDNGILIIRSHGVPPLVLEKAKKKKLKIVDATCPFVKNAQNICCLLKKENYDIIIIGESEHPEVEALVGFAGEKAHVVKDGEGLLSLETGNKIGILSQTTQPFKNVQSVIQKIDWAKYLEVRVFDTICDATSKRQESALNIAKDVDVMIVIGGYNSSNTKKLAQLCEESGVKTFHIESIKDLDLKLISKTDVVGITAGASTPSWLIEEVVENLQDSVETC